VDFVAGVGFRFFACGFRLIGGGFCGFRLLAGPVQWELRRLGEKPVGRKTFGRIIFWGDRRLGDKLGRYGDSKLDGWATLFRRLGEMCERGETQN